MDLCIYTTINKYIHILQLPLLLCYVRGTNKKNNNAMPFYSMHIYTTSIIQHIYIMHAMHVYKSGHNNVNVVVRPKRSKYVTFHRFFPYSSPSLSLALSVDTTKAETNTCTNPNAYTEYTCVFTRDVYSPKAKTTTIRFTGFTIITTHETAKAKRIQNAQTSALTNRHTIRYYTQSYSVL
jgi:hypothetical protein